MVENALGTFGNSGTLGISGILGNSDLGNSGISGTLGNSDLGSFGTFDNSGLGTSGTLGSVCTVLQLEIEFYLDNLCLIKVCIKGFYRILK